jgi:hypothetical protein
MGWEPTLLDVTVSVIVQEEFAGTVGKGKRVAEVKPPYEKPLAPQIACDAVTDMLVGETATSRVVIEKEFGFVIVTVSVEVPPEAMLAGLNEFEGMVKWTVLAMVRVAVLLAAPAVVVCVVVTPEVVLFSVPVVELVTLKITVQLLLAGIVMPVKLADVAPAVKVVGVVPEQVPVTEPPDAVMPVGKVSLKAPPVS